MAERNPETNEVSDVSRSDTNELVSDSTQGAQAWASNTQNEQSASEPAAAMYSSAEIQQLLRLLANQQANATPTSSEQGTAQPVVTGQFAAQQPQPQPAAIPTQPQSSPWLPNAAQGQDFLNAVLASPQAFTALMPLFAQWLQLLVQQAPQQVQPQVFPVIQLLQQLLAPNQAAISQVDSNAVYAAFLQSFAYFQGQQQQQFQAPLASSVVPANPYVPNASSMPWMASATTPTVAVPCPTAATTTASQQPAPSSTTKASHKQDDKTKAAEKPSPKKRRRYKMEAFPEKLHRLITDAKANNNDSIVRFTEDGLKFQILNCSEFEKLLPGYFRHGHISSFKRSLHMYDFKRIQGTWEEGTIFHPKFRRDEPELCREIERVDRGFGSMY